MMIIRKVIDTLLNNRIKVNKWRKRCETLGGVIEKKGFEKYSGHYQVVKNEYFMGDEQEETYEILNNNFTACLNPFFG